jgi:hypothetical protein
MAQRSLAQYESVLEKRRKPEAIKVADWVRSLDTEEHSPNRPNLKSSLADAKAHP